MNFQIFYTDHVVSLDICLSGREIPDFESKIYNRDLNKKSCTKSKVAKFKLRRLQSPTTNQPANPSTSGPLPEAHS